MWRILCLQKMEGAVSLNSRGWSARLTISYLSHIQLCEVCPPAGHGLTLRQYRDGVEVNPAVDEDLNYDFNFQQYRSVAPRKVMPVSTHFERSYICYLGTDTGQHNHRHICELCMPLTCR